MHAGIPGALTRRMGLLSLLNSFHFHLSRRCVVCVEQGKGKEVGEPPERAALPAASPAQPAPGRAPFIAAVAFAGAKSGYIFSKGAQGVGYYVDTGPVGSGNVLSGAAAAADGRKKTAGAPPPPSPTHTRTVNTAYWCPKSIPTIEKSARSH